jgi:hypothetical protein
MEHKAEKKFDGAALRAKERNRETHSFVLEGIRNSLVFLIFSFERNSICPFIANHSN